ncbi:MAG: hypothetical protein NTX40_03025, partial [Planctomycetota bacterium]|nr:hypothetical protein [Planctomycetota bacterium]
GRLLESAGFAVRSVAHRTSFLHPPTAAISLLPWTDPQRFWAAEQQGGGAGALARRFMWAATTLAVAPAVWIESLLGASAIPTAFAQKKA